MSTYAITMVRDEEDIVAETIDHMLSQVDHVIVADNGSRDSTREIVGAFPVTVITDPDPAYYQSQKMTALARRARDLGAEWIVPFDADEIWLSPHGRIADVLAAQPNALVAPAPIYNHFATALDDPELPATERMGWRWAAPLGLPKVACRALPGLSIHAGNHGASFDGMDELRAVDGLLEVRHFPYRTPEQFVRKARNGAAAYAATDLPFTTGQHWREYGALIEAGGDEAGEAWFAEHFFIDDPENDESLVFDPCLSKSLSPG